MFLKSLSSGPASQQTCLFKSPLKDGHIVIKITRILNKILAVAGGGRSWRREEEETNSSPPSDAQNLMSASGKVPTLKPGFKKKSWWSCSGGPRRAEEMLVWRETFNKHVSQKHPVQIL